MRSYNSTQLRKTGFKNQTKPTATNSQTVSGCFQEKTNGSPALATHPSAANSMLPKPTRCHPRTVDPLRALSHFWGPVLFPPQKKNTAAHLQRSQLPKPHASAPSNVHWVLGLGQVAPPSAVPRAVAISAMSISAMSLPLHPACNVERRTQQ